MGKRLTKKIHFFRDCLEAESQSKTLWNIHSNQAEYVRRAKLGIFESTNQVEISDSYSEQLTKSVDRYKREKQLLLCRYFIIANHDISAFGGRTRGRKICCPIFYFPAEIVPESFQRRPALAIDRARGVINPAIKQFFQSYDVDVDKELNRILDYLSLDAGESKRLSGNLTDKTSDHIVSSLAHIVEKLQTNAADRRVEFDAQDDRSSNQVLKTLDPNVIHLNLDSVSCLIRKQQSAQGVLHELDKLIARPNMSTPLAMLLHESNYTPLKPKDGFWRLRSDFWRWLTSIGKPDSKFSIPIPAVLSSEQTRVVNNSSDEYLSVVQGPPGTGKSFTIASLALNEFAKGNSVLVVSQNQHAVDVVRRKLVDDFSLDQGLTVLGSEKGVSKEVKKQILELISSDHHHSEAELNKVEAKLQAVLRAAFSAENEFVSECSALLNTDEPSQAESGSLISGFFKQSTIKAEADSAEQRLLNSMLDDIEELDSRAHALISKQINIRYRKVKSLATSDRDVRSSLKFFSQSLSARTERKQNEYYESVDYAKVLNVLPLWFASVSNLHRLLPLRKDLFDVVIIDEATQCNMAVCIPALYRAKRAVIVGDPKQLKHVSFVSYQEQQRMFNRHELISTDISDDFRNNSVIDYALSACNSSDQTANLDEHFRSHPQIIGFSNQHFYDNSLKVMTQKPSHVGNAVTIVHCDGERKASLNKKEAEEIIATLKSLVAQQQGVPDPQAHSVGILSFFSDQAEYIEKRVFDELSLNELRKHNIRCGTPFSFQGEERDHMLISCCVDENTSGSAYNYLNRDDVFNVAITRARDAQTLFLSCPVDKVNSKSKLKDYLKYIKEFESSQQTRNFEAEDSYQNQVCWWLQEQGVTVFKNYLVAGTSIDIIAVYQDKSIAIDLIGFDGLLRGALELDRYKLLRRAGLTSFLMPYNEWTDKRTELLEALMLKLGLRSERQTQGSLEPQVNAQSFMVDSQDEAEFNQLFGVSLSGLHNGLIETDDHRAGKQVELLIDKHRKFLVLLQRHFQPEELTYRRYLNAFRSLLENTVNNLQNVSSTLDIVSDLLSQQQSFIATRYVAKGDSGSDGIDGQLRVLYDERSSMIDQQRANIHRLLLNNESALLQMDRTIIKLTHLQTSGPMDMLDAEDVLEEMTDKLDLYEKK